MGKVDFPPSWALPSSLHFPTTLHFSSALEDVIEPFKVDFYL